MTTTMGELANWRPPAADDIFYQNLLQTLDALYPANWRDWVVSAIKYKDLFGGTLAPDTEARLRFAIPTVRLAKIFRCGNSLSERRYRKLKRKLLEWPIGLALIYQPITIMTKIHPVGVQNEFDAILLSLKPYLVSRKEASDALKAEAEEDNVTSGSSRASKRHCSPEPLPDPKVPRTTESFSAESLKDYMRQQNEILGRLCELTYGLTHPPPPTLQTETHAPPESDSTADEAEEAWDAPPLGEEHEEDIEEEPLLDFAPETKESEGKISKASEKLVEEGTHCQKLESDGWKNIRYADVQKQFQASPVFTALKLNGHLATVSPQWQLVSVLEKMDQCLGAITHGLLQQRKEFIDACTSAPPEVKAYLTKNLAMKEKAPFRKVSDALLQYTCGKRAEVLEQRRALFKPQNKTISDLLHAIPPSTTHLFAEPQLSDLIKEQGGLSKVFPGKFKKPSQFVPKPKNKQDSKEKRPFRKSNFRNFDRANTRPSNQRPPPKNRRRYDAKKY